jgi:hypothetical protein
MNPPAFGSPARSRTPPALRREFRNDRALAGWIFMIIWLSFLACFSYLFVRDGGFPQLGIWGLPVMGLFWVFGLGGLCSAGSVARLRLALGADGVTLSERFLFERREKRYRSRDIAAPQVEAGKDGEGDTCYFCVLAFADGRHVRITEGSDRAEIDAFCRSLEASLVAYCRGFDPDFRPFATRD